MTSGWTPEARAKTGALNLIAFPFPHVTAQWIAERVAGGMSNRAIAAEAGCSNVTIAKRRPIACAKPAKITRTGNYSNRPLGNSDGKVSFRGQWPADMPADAFKDAASQRPGRLRMLPPPSLTAEASS